MNTRNFLPWLIAIILVPTALMAVLWDYKYDDRMIYEGQVVTTEDYDSLLNTITVDSLQKEGMVEEVDRARVNAKLYAEQFKTMHQALIVSLNTERTVLDLQNKLTELQFDLDKKFYAVIEWKGYQIYVYPARVESGGQALSRQTIKKIKPYGQVMDVNFYNRD